MIDLKIFKENNPSKNIQEELKLNDTINSIIKKYGEEIISTLFETLGKVERWQTEGLKTNKKETNKEHTLEMLYLAHMFFNKNPKLNDFLDFETICIKIAIHDLGEVGTGDLTIDQKEGLSKEDQIKYNNVELDFGLRILNILKGKNINIHDIRNLERHYIDYDRNKSNNLKLNDYFVKFLDKYQALLFIIENIPEFKDFERYSINTIYNELFKKNIVFKEYGVDLLKNFETIIRKNEEMDIILKK